MGAPRLGVGARPADDVACRIEDRRHHFGAAQINAQNMTCHFADD
jgi:hypothetical protein